MYGPYFPWDHGTKHPIEEVKTWKKENKITVEVIDSNGNVLNDESNFTLID